MISWIWPFALFVGGSGVGAEDQEPPDQGEEAAGQGRGVPRRAGGHPTGSEEWAIQESWCSEEKSAETKWKHGAGT